MHWTDAEIEYIETYWGETSVTGMARKIGRTVDAIRLKASRIGLTSHLHSGEHITLRQLMLALGRRGTDNYFFTSFVEKRGLPIIYKRVIKRKYRVIYIKDFWKWAKEHRTFVDFSRMEENILGEEPSWVKEQRRADVLFAQYKQTPWTKAEDDYFTSLVLSGKHNYRSISIAIKRTEGAIKKRLLELKIKRRPLKEDNHTPWTPEEIKTLSYYLAKGYKPEVIAEHINRSATSIRGKIGRLKNINATEVDDDIQQGN